MEKSSCLNPLAHTCGVVSGNTQTLPSTVTVVLSWEICQYYVEYMYMYAL